MAYCTASGLISASLVCHATSEAAGRRPLNCGSLKLSAKGLVIIFVAFEAFQQKCMIYDKYTLLGLIHW